MTEHKSKLRCFKCGLWLLPANGGAFRHVANGHTGRGCTNPFPLSEERYNAQMEGLAAGARAAIAKAEGVQS